MTTYFAHTKNSSTLRLYGQICLVAGLLGARRGSISHLRLTRGF